MDPFVLGLVAVMGASAAVAARLRRARKTESVRVEGSKPRAAAAQEPGALRVGDVLTYLGDEFWLAGELLLVREGAAAMRLFSAPERGGDRWVALLRDGRSVWVLHADRELSALGWPGIEVPTGEGLLRRFEHGNAAIVPSGEITGSWEGMGRFALFRGQQGVAVVLEGPTKERLALRGREIPRELLQKLG